MSDQALLFQWSDNVGNKCNCIYNVVLLREAVENILSVINLL